MAVDHGRDAVRASLRVLRGEPTAEELAVVTALMSAAAASIDERPRPAPQRGRWNDPAALYARLPHPGPGAWRAALR